MSVSTPSKLSMPHFLLNRSLCLSAHLLRVCVRLCVSETRVFLPQTLNRAFYFVYCCKSLFDYFFYKGRWSVKGSRHTHTDLTVGPAVPCCPLQTAVRVAGGGGRWGWGRGDQPGPTPQTTPWVQARASSSLWWSSGGCNPVRAEALSVQLAYASAALMPFA